MEKYKIRIYRGIGNYYIDYYVRPNSHITVINNRSLIRFTEYTNQDHYIWINPDYDKIIFIEKV